MRAAAIACVLVSHVATAWCAWLGLPMPAPLAKGGFLGVEIFFVLSGFLVGRLLISAAAAPGVGAWGRFMARRWLRTLPLYWAWLAVLLAVFPPLFWLPDHRALLPRAVVTYGLFLQNLDWHTPWGNWFGVAWSLSVEEWFYLLGSVFVMVLARRMGVWRAVGFFLAIALSVPVVRRFLDPPDAALPYSVLTALDQIGWGVVAAACNLRAPARFARAGWLALPGLLLAVGFFQMPQALFDGRPHLVHALGPDMLGVGIALCLPALARWRHAHGMFAAATRWLAVRSYGFYLTHLSVLEMIGTWRYAHGGGNPVLLVALSAGLIVTIPVLCWRFLEQPMLRLRPASSAA